MGPVRRIWIGLLCVLVLPAAAWAVRPHASPVAQANYRGTNSEGPVSFHMTLAYNEGYPGHPAFWEYLLSDFRFATECQPSGLRLPKNVTIDKKQRRQARVLHFALRRHNIQISVTISGKNLSTAHGTARISSRRCDGDTLPFTASLVG